MFLLALLLASAAGAQSPSSTSATSSSASAVITEPPQYTNVFIDDLPVYWSFQPCAQSPLSRIVKDMASGCGVTGTVYSSFDCFCTSSSSTMNWIIDSAVMLQCSTDPGGASTASQLATSALGIFHSYCELPVVMAATETMTSAATSVPSSASAASPGPAKSSSSGRKHLSGGAIAGIAVGCIVGALLLLGALLYFLWLRRNVWRDGDSKWQISRPTPISTSFRSSSFATSPSVAAKADPEVTIPESAVVTIAYNPVVEVPGDPNQLHELPAGGDVRSSPLTQHKVARPPSHAHPAKK